MLIKIGDMLKGAEHKPWAENECKVMLVEPAGTVNTGEKGGRAKLSD